MTPVITIFTFSGAIIALLLAAKGIEGKMEGRLFILRLISRGDIYVRNLYHKVIHYYTDTKEHASFLWEKQIPMHSRNSKNKLVTFLKEKREQYVESMRDAKILKRNDGISEFFKSISEVEKGNGTIHEELEDSFQESENRVN